MDKKQVKETVEHLLAYGFADSTIVTVIEKMTGKLAFLTEDAEGKIIVELY